MCRRVSRTLLCLALSLPTLLWSGVEAMADESSPAWQTTADGGFSSNDVATHMAVSRSSNVASRAVFLTGSSAKPAALQAAGVNDQDVLTAAYEPTTGVTRWQQRFDGDFASDSAASIEVNYNNNLLYVPINSGSDLVLMKYAIRDGSESTAWTYPSARANDSAISGAGGFMGLAGTSGGDFHVISFETGRTTLDLDARPTRGEAFSADIMWELPWGDGGLDAHRTLLATGRENGSGTGGDIYTVAYNYRYPERGPTWAARWASSGNRSDQGIATRSAWISSLGKGVAFVAGRTHDPVNGFDIVVLAYDLATGAPMWEQRFDGDGHDDDVPVDLAYSDASETLYVVGSSERGFPNGRDIVTLAFDGITGARKAAAFAGGDASNGDDDPTTIEIAGDRVFIGGEIMNRFDTGYREVALFAYDPALNPAGSRSFGGSSPSYDHAAGAAVDPFHGHVVLAGSTQQGSAGLDHHLAAYGVDGFEVTSTASRLDFVTQELSGQFSDEATIKVRLSDTSGTSVAGREVSIALGEDVVSATTGPDGVARADFLLDLQPGTYPVTVGFEGSEPYLPSRLEGAFEVLREDSSLVLSVQGNGAHRTLTASLRDADSVAPIAGRDVSFYSEGVLLGTTRTDASGVATFDPGGRYQGGPRTFEATFEGDDFFLPSTGSAGG